MPSLIVKTPQNKQFIKKHSTYKSHINMMESKQTAVQRQLRRGGVGSYELDVQAAFFAFCELHSNKLCLYDIGSHIGLYSVMISTIFHSFNPFIIAFEPSPETAKINKTIRDINNLSYTVTQKAISSQNGNMELYISPIAESSNSLNPTFIAKFKPVIICELLTKSNLELTGAMLSALEWLGYKFFRVDPMEEWEPYSASEVIKNLSNEYRDWILSPDLINDQFNTLFKQWQTSLGKCDQATNKLIKHGDTIPSKLFANW